MNPEELALLQAVCANPDDDLPRLVYADWLEEQGQPDRAEFIRLQLENHRQGLTLASCEDRTVRETTLFTQHFSEWIGHLPAALQENVEFRRGFIYSVQCRVNDLLSLNELPQEPIQALLVEVDDLPLNWFDLATPVLLRIPLRELAIACHVPIGQPLVLALNSFGPYPLLQELHLSDPGLDAASLGSFQAQRFPALTTLDLQHCDFDDQAVMALLDTDLPEQLQTLILPRRVLSPSVVGWARHLLGPRVKFR